MKKHKPGMRKIVHEVYLGHVRDPEVIITNAQEIGHYISQVLSYTGKTGFSPYQQYWYSLQQVKKILEHTESELLSDLKNLGVVTPEHWDFSSLHNK